MRAAYILPLLMLTACGPASPTWMPAGYSYHNDEYKAQPGPEAKNLGYPYSKARNDYINSMWADVARSLIDSLESQTGMTAQPVYLEKLPQTNAFNLSLDNALREELRARGYNLADVPGDAIHIQYRAFEPGDENKRPHEIYNDDDGQKELQAAWKPENAREFIFVLTLLRDNAPFSEVRAKQVMPAFGYVAGEGSDVPAPRVMEKGLNP